MIAHVSPVDATPEKGGLYKAANGCDCGSDLRIWLRPADLPRVSGAWHARCVRCDAPFYWLPATTTMEAP